MKFCMQRSALAFLASFIVYSGSAIADAPAEKPTQTPPSPVPVVLGNPKYTVEVNFTALILQPYANNLDYAAEAIPFNYGDKQPAVSPSWIIPEISPDYHFGFDVGIAGIFHGAKSSLSLNWERYHSPNDSNSRKVSSDQFMIGPFFEIGPDAQTYKKAKGSVHFHFDEVNLHYGTFVNFGKHLHTNLFAGVSYARIVQNRFTRFQDPTKAVVRTIKVPSKFNGAGPQFGLNFTYKIVNGFQFVGNAQASLYVGTFENRTRFSTKSTDLAALGDINPNVQSTKVKDKMGIVPGLEGKLGLAYQHLFRRHYMFKLEAGYQAQIYINSIRSIDMGSEVALAAIGSIGSATTGVYARTFERTVSDFGLAGPYVAVDFGF
ncbi:MAG: hypothetical protein JSR39_03205 [Verrucomicrobia bacterium]|nr:hypothetical protein [Verrucomicrobiota bacterium]